MRIRFLHLSDFHLGSEKEPVGSFNQNQVIDSLVEYVGKLAKDGSPFDFVVITGDLANKAKKEEYAAAEKMCGDLRKNLSLDKSRLFIVPGNHDVEWGKIAPYDIERVYSFSSQNDISGVLLHRYIFPGLMEKFGEFNRFAENVMGQKRFDEKNYHYAQTLEISRKEESRVINLLGLNSALFAGYDGDDNRKLALGIYQVDAALKRADKTADLSIAFFHHPFSCFHPCDEEARDMLTQNVDLILTGHTHKPKNSFRMDPSGQVVLIGAGASFEKRESHNAFDIVEIDLETGKGRVQFYAYVFEQKTWVKNNRANPLTDGVFSFQIRHRPKPGGGSEARSEKDKAREDGQGDKQETDDIQTGGNGKDETETEKASALRISYLNRLINETGSMALRGIDPKAAGARSQSRLSLQAVYTALMTRGGDMEGAGLLGTEKNRAPLSALALLDRSPHLVLLGEPGSGKSTFVNFITLCLAGEGLNRDDANIETMTAPTPEDDGKNSEKRQPWRHGPLLPVRIVLRDFVAWEGFSKKGGENASSEDIWRFIRHRLEKASLGDYARFLKDELLEKGGLALFDGLDEAPETDKRRERIKRAVEDFAASFPKCRVMVTSRTYAYQKQDWRIDIPGITEAVLSLFTRGQIHRFIDNWYVYIAELDARNKEDALGDAELLRRAVFNSKNLMELAERPLLLTLIASLHAWRGGTLPENREELYADALELLLDLWESPKTVKDANGSVRLIQPSLIEWLQLPDRKKMRRFLNELAFKVHNRQEDPANSVETADIPEDELTTGLMRLTPDPNLKPRLLVEYLSERAGVIIPRGEGVYAFPHRTFQEYLAACHLTDTDYPCLMAKLARHDPERWREAALLAGAKSIKGTESAIWMLVDALCFRDPDSPETTMEDVWGAHLAGRMLAENVNSLHMSEYNEPKRDRVKRWLLHIMTGDRLPASERVIAGNSLSVLGDTRFDSNFWFLPGDPEMGFIEIPAGPFLMGSTREEVELLKSNPPEGLDEETTKLWECLVENEFPRHTVEMSEYRISRYPVTAAQFRAFIRDSGYKADKRWEAENRHGSHPAVHVSWQDAVAYCAWLTKKLKARGLDRIVSLPSEAQWEKAARDEAGGRYPWGDADIDPERANHRETGIGATSPVGCFPRGDSPHGASDMIGNVWEWCRDACDVDFNTYKIITDTYREGQADPICKKGSYRVLRGGSWGNVARLCRSAFRYIVDPAGRNAYGGFRLVLLPGQG